MDTQMTDTEIVEALHALQTSVQVQQVSIQIQNESIRALEASVVSLQNGQAVLQADVVGIKTRLDMFAEHYATKADVEKVQAGMEIVRAELYKSLNAQTWKLFTAMTTVCSSLVIAVYQIARYVH